MVFKLNQIFEVLKTIQLYEDKNIKPTLISIKKILNHIPLEFGQFIEIDELLKFCNDSNLIKINDDLIYTNDVFSQLLNLLNSKEIEKCKALLRKNFLDNEAINQKFLNGITNFNSDSSGVWIDMNRVVDSFSDSKFIDILWELDILQEKKDLAILNPELNIDRTIFRKKKERPQAQAELDEIQKIQKEIGEIAEEIVLEFEKIRLTQLNCPREVSKINQISMLNTNAGYDIESFEKSEFGVNDIFIEVKGTTKKELNFYWSANEIKVAEELQDRYWLYYVSEIDRETRKSPHEPKRIRNPFKTIFNDDSFIKEQEITFHITKIDSI